MKEKPIFVVHAFSRKTPDYFIRASTADNARKKAAELYGEGVSFSVQNPTPAERVFLNLGRVKVYEAE